MHILSQESASVIDSSDRHIAVTAVPTPQSPSYSITEDTKYVPSVKATDDPVTESSSSEQPTSTKQKLANINFTFFN